VSSITIGVLSAGLLAATVIDLRTRRIPNMLTASMAALGLGLAAAGASDNTIGASLAGLVFGLLLMLPGYALGATGAGDVKLMAAVGAILGPALVLLAFICTSIAGSMLAVLIA
jgi:prepilin peptidase CpaA